MYRTHQTDVPEERSDEVHIPSILLNSLEPVRPGADLVGMARSSEGGQARSFHFLRARAPIALFGNLVDRDRRQPSRL